MVAQAAANFIGEAVQANSMFHSLYDDDGSAGGGESSPPISVLPSA